jgi:rhodanese-related sulfurtransferase
VERLLEFAGRHPELFAALGVIVALLVWTSVRGRLQGIRSVGPVEATLLISHEDALVLDVREPHEVKDGLILNSVHVPLGQVRDHLGKLEKYKDRPVIVGCRSGSRSHSAAALLAKAGFAQVYNLQGGLLAWQNANLPLVKK